MSTFCHLHVDLIEKVQSEVTLLRVERGFLAKWSSHEVKIVVLIANFGVFCF